MRYHRNITHVPSDDDTDMNPSRVATIEAHGVRHRTPLGTMISQWTARGLYSLRWVSPTDAPDVISGSRGEQDQMLDDLLLEYFSTGDADFRSLTIDPSGWSPFAGDVYRCCREIPSGTTITYRQLAERSGSGTAHRAVGSLMSRNRLLLVIPCHRVVASNGALQGFSAPGGIQTKRFLLDLEAA